VDAHQALHAETAIGRVEVGGVQHVVAKMTHEKAAREVTMEGLGHKRIGSYFVHFSQISRFSMQIYAKYLKENHFCPKNRCTCIILCLFFTKTGKTLTSVCVGL
jgi:hypothetical protein